MQIEEGGVSKDYLACSQFRNENIKKAENYDLQEALENWKGKKKQFQSEALATV